MLVDVYFVWYAANSMPADPQPPCFLIQKFRKKELFAHNYWVFVFVPSVPTAQRLLCLMRLQIDEFGLEPPSSREQVEVSRFPWAWAGGQARKGRVRLYQSTVLRGWVLTCEQAVQHAAFLSVTVLAAQQYVLKRGLKQGGLRAPVLRLCAHKILCQNEH